MGILEEDSTELRDVSSISLFKDKTVKCEVLLIGMKEYVAISMGIRFLNHKMTETELNSHEDNYEDKYAILWGRHLSCL